MKLLLTTVSLIGLSAMVPTAPALPVQPDDCLCTPTPQDSETVSGMIASILEDGKSFQLRTDDGVVTIKVDSSTEFSLDGAPTDRVSALKVGYEATVHRQDGLATRVEAKSHVEPPT